MIFPGGYGNAGGAAATVRVDRYSEMVAFDALPGTFRDRLRTMTEPWSALQVTSSIAKRGEAFTMALLDRVENDAQVAYRKRCLNA